MHRQQHAERNATASSIETTTCPHCGDPLAADAVLCCACGYHRDLGITMQTETGVEMPWTARARITDSAESARSAYLKPLLLLVIATGLLIGIQLIIGGPADAVGSMIGWTIGVPLGLVAYWICAVLWIGHDAPLHLTALRLTAVYAMTDLVTAVLPFPMLSWPLALFIYVGLLMDLLELDMTDAVAVAVLTFAFKVAVFLVAFSLFMG